MKVVKNIGYNELVKKVNVTQATDTSNLVRYLTMIQKLVKLKRKYLIMIMVNILVHKNVISRRQIILQQD